MNESILRDAVARSPLQILAEIHESYSAILDVMPDSPKFAPYRKLLANTNGTFSEFIEFMDSILPPCSEAKELHRCGNH
jgi:hypothetical protein